MHGMLSVRDMRSFGVLALGLCVAIVVAARPAHAYCRTTTSQVPNGYNPAITGCWPDGKPLAWHGSRVPIGVVSTASSQISFADATRIEELAFGVWNDIVCPGGRPSIQAFDDGPITQVPQSGCSSSAGCDAAVNDYIIFDDAAWPHDDPANALGLTTVTFGVDDGRIFAAYTEINTAQKTIVAQEPAPPGAYDLQSILTHEAGHFFGLAHSTEASAVMYAFYHSGATNLTADDMAGFCAIYPPASQSGGGGGGCAVGPLRAGHAFVGAAGGGDAFVGAVGGGDALGAVAVALVALGMLVRRR
jgi:hypothetical protein